MAEPSGMRAGRGRGLAKLRGVWRSHGYGTLLEVGAVGYRLYEETAISRLLVFEGPVSELAEHYVDVRLSPGGRAFSARRATGVTRVKFRRLKTLPHVRLEPAEGLLPDPIYNFEIFWYTFFERYALFGLRGVDWERMHDRHRPEIDEGTGARRLFDTFVEMLRPLRDGHVELSAPCGRFNAAGPPPAQERLAARMRAEGDDRDVLAVMADLRERSRALVAERYLASGIRRAAHGLMGWGQLDASTGYLAIRAMAGQSGRANRAREDQQAAASAMERALRDIGHLPALVVDLRENGGGYDGVALRIAGHLTDRKRLAFTKAASKGEGYGGVQSVFIEPRGKQRYRGRIFLLTSGLTASAAEIFVLCLLRHPRLTRIGAATQGILSDVMERHLPNGWRMTLSNELYTASDGELYEDRGIPPHVEIPFLDHDDVDAGRDPMLDHVLRVSREGG